MFVFFIQGYVADLLTRIFNRRRMNQTIAKAKEDYNETYDALPPLTQGYQQFNKDELVRNRASRFAQ